MNLYDIILKLIGPIKPIGSSEEDVKRLENLKALTSVVDSLVRDIDEVAQYKTRIEWSMKTAGEYASKFMDHLGIGG